MIELIVLTTLLVEKSEVHVPGWSGGVTRSSFKPKNTKKRNFKMTDMMSWQKNSKITYIVSIRGGSSLKEKSKYDEDQLIQIDISQRKKEI